MGSLGSNVSSFTRLCSTVGLTADPGVGSLITAQSHTFVEIDHEIISKAILLPSADSRRDVVNYKRLFAKHLLTA